MASPPRNARRSKLAMAPLPSSPVRAAAPGAFRAVPSRAGPPRRLRHEVGRQLARPATDLAIHTLHAFGRKVIDTWRGKLGFSDHSPAVMHREEARELLARAATELGWDLSTVSPSELATAVDRHRLALETPSAADDPLAALALAYEERLQRR